MMDTVGKPHYRLIGTEISLFTGKARAYLKWKGISFTEVIASRDVYAKVIGPLTNTAMIPALLLPGDPPRAIQDTRSIIRYIESAHGSTTPHACIPTTPRRAAAANLIELLSDQWLVVQAMYWRWAPRSAAHRPFILSEFGNTMMGGAKSSFEARLAKEKTSKMKFYELLPGLGIDEKVGEAVEKQFRVLLGMLESHLEEWRFVLGDRISLADFSLYGPFYAHLWRDPVSGYIIRTEFPLVSEWVERVQGLGRGGSWNTEVLNRDGTFSVDYPSGPDSLEQSDSLPPTLQPFLKLLLDDYLPILADSCGRIRQYLETGKAKSPPQKLNLERREGWVVVPRGVGKHEFLFSAGDGTRVKGTRNVMTHGVWMVEEMVKELGDGGCWGDVLEWAGCDKALWELARKELKDWEIVRDGGLYMAAKTDGPRL